MCVYPINIVVDRHKGFIQITAQRIHTDNCPENTVNRAEYSTLDAPSRRPTEGITALRTDGRTDGRSDTPFYRDATAHLKVVLKSTFE